MSKVLQTKYHQFSQDETMSLTPADIDRIIQMAWEDRTAFDSIRAQFGLTPGQVIKLMRTKMKPSSFRMWRARTTGRKTKHVALRDSDVGRFRCPDQKGS
jgi:uncharacterized protein (TIGR03643 family)